VRYLTDAELASSIHAQASRLGAEILVGAELINAAPTDHGTFRIELTCGSVVEVRSGVVATGVDYRRLEAPGIKQFVGAGSITAPRPEKQSGCKATMWRS
jgi:thioredoxin reductase (NADPH)